VIWFSPWSTITDGDPRLAFLRLLQKQLASLTKTAPKTKNNPGMRKRLDNLLKALTKIIDMPAVQAGLTVSLPLVGALAPVISGMSILASALIENSQDGETSGDESRIDLMRLGVRRLLLDIANYKEEKYEENRKILLLVDDLDRARPEEAVAVLDSLYHLFMPHEVGGSDKDWPLTSVWAVNTAVLEEFLYREYRELPSFDPNAYLEKLFSQRINVPPLIENPKQNGKKHTNSGDTSKLWRQDLKSASAECQDIDLSQKSDIDGLAQRLSGSVNYAILGNLRLHARVRRDCLRLWCETKTKTGAGTGDFVRDARLIVLIDAFSYFREQIAPFNGMWPHFLNQINKRLTDRPMEWVANPLYRHVDSPDLATLLEDLGVIRFEENIGRYTLDNDGRKRLQEHLIQFWEHGI
jgi:hypothetical protein